MVLAEHLGQERPEGYQGGEDADPELDLLLLKCGLDHGAVEEILIGEDSAVAQRIGLSLGATKSILGHEWPPCEQVMGRCVHPCLSQGAPLLSISNKRFAFRLFQCHSSL